MHKNPNFQQHRSNLEGIGMDFGHHIPRVQICPVDPTCQWISICRCTNLCTEISLKGYDGRSRSSFNEHTNVLSFQKQNVTHRVPPHRLSSTGHGGPFLFPCLQGFSQERDSKTFLWVVFYLACWNRNENFGKSHLWQQISAIFSPQCVHTHYICDRHQPFW